MSFYTFGQLSGILNVGAGQTYTTTQSVCDDLVLQGMDAPVIIAIHDGTYTETVVLDVVAGNDADNYIIFTSASQDSTLVTIGNSTFAPTFRINSPYVGFEYMKIINNGYLGSAIEYAETEIIYISNVTIVAEGSALYSLYGDATKDDGELNVDINNCIVYAEGGFMIEDSRSIKQSNFSDLEIYTESNAIHISSIGYEISGITFDNLLIEVPSGNAIYIEPGINFNNIEFTNSEITAEGYGFYVSMAKSSINNVNFSNLDITTGDASIYLYANFNAHDIMFTNINIETLNGGISVEGYDNYVSDIYVKDVNINYENESGEHCGFKLYTDGLMRDVSISESAFTGGYEGYMFILDSDVGLYNIEIDDIEINNTYSITSGSGIKIDNVNGLTENISITNSSITNCQDKGLFLNMGSGTKNLLIDNCNFEIISEDASGRYIDMYHNDGTMDSLIVTNCTFDYSAGPNILPENHPTASGLKFYGSDGNITNSYFANLQINSYSRGLEVEFSDGLNNVLAENITVNIIDSEGFEFKVGDGGIKNLTVQNNQIFNKEGDGIIIEGGNVITENIFVINNHIEINDSTAGIGIEIQADDNILNNVYIANNYIKANNGIETEGDYGGSHNILIENNEIYATNKAIYVDGVGDNYVIQNNNFYANEGQLTQYGIDFSAGDSYTEEPVIIQNTEKSGNFY